MQSGQKVSLDLMITIQGITWLNLIAWESTGMGQGDTRLTLTPSVISNSNYVIMVSD
jgi:hypothetical protein